MNNNTGMGLMLFCIVLTAVLILKGGKQESTIKNWADSNGYEIVEYEEKTETGPFQSKEKSQKIYRAKIKDGNNYKWVWFRIGILTDVLEER